MRTITVTRDIAPHTAETVRQRLLDPSCLRAFHGPDTTVQPWTLNERVVSFVVESKGSPIRLAPDTRAVAVQTWKNGQLRNRMTLENMSLLEVDSVWTVGDTTLFCTAKLTVNAPPPLNWLAEQFVAIKARRQISSFASFVLTSLLHTP